MERQELGIVTEPGGKVAVRIHVTNSNGLNEWHNDNKNAKKEQVVLKRCLLCLLIRITK